ncbi:uncharacterized protein [Medicago truncatula]|uniref:uncharacterized protein n=1 Tax=Medicago truncatula TaxID=3880 RepID=UPI0019670443|nr:uncharacterized protein LOC120577411 [Medicago truncatula]
MELAQKRRPKNKNNKVAKKQKVGNTEGDPHATIKKPFLPKKQKVQKTAEKCRSKKRKVKFYPIKFYDKPFPKEPLRIDWDAASEARRKGINLLGEIISKFKIQRARELEEWKEKKRAREEEEKKEKKSQFAKTCLSKDKKIVLEYVPMDYNRCKKLSSFDMDHYLAVIEERRKAIEKALQEDKEKLEVDIDRANATDMEEE